MKDGDFMNFDKDKLKVTFGPTVTPTSPIQNRKYTLTHSDSTGILYLYIGQDYNYYAINETLRDELLGKWKLRDYNSYVLIFYAYVGDNDFLKSSMKYGAFKYHLQMALQAIFYGDKELLEEHKYLLDSPIYIKFDSDIPMFDNYEQYGYVKDYII